MSDFAIPKEIKINTNDAKKIFPSDDEKILTQLRITDIGLYSITTPEQADFIRDILIRYFTIDKLNSMTISDVGAGVGGQTYALAKYFKKVNVIEISPLHFEIISHNMSLLNLNADIEEYNQNYITIMDDLKQDIIFFDPPWGGVNYKKSKICNIIYKYKGVDYHIEDIVSKKSTLPLKVAMIILKLPVNYDVNRIIKHSPFISNELIPICNKWKAIYNILILSHTLPSKHNIKSPVFPTLGYKRMKFTFVNK